MKLRAAITALAVLFAMPVAAQQPSCGPLMRMEFNLISQWGEEVIEEETIITDDGPVLFQLWASAETSTWTLTGTNGVAMCYFRAGDNSRDVNRGMLLNREEA